MERNKSTIRILGTRRNKRPRRILQRKGALIVTGGGTLNPKVKILSIDPLEIFSETPTEITITLNVKALIKQVKVLSEAGQEVYTGEVGERKKEIKFKVNLAVGTYTFQVTVNSKTLSPEYKLVVEEVVPEIDLPYYTVIHQDKGVQWKSQDQTMRIECTKGLPLVYNLKGKPIEKNRYTYPFEFEAPGIYKTEVYKNGQAVLFKNIIVLSSELAIYSLFPCIITFGTELDIELTFNQRFPRSLIKNIFLEGVQSGKKYIFKDENINMVTEDVYNLHYDKSITEYEQNLKLKITASDPENTELISQAISMYQNTTQSVTAKISPNEFTKNMSVTGCIKFDPMIEFTTPLLSMLFLNATPSTISGNKVIGDYYFSIYLTQIGLPTFYVNELNSIGGVIVSDKCKSITSNMPQCTSVSPDLAGKGEWFVYHYITEESLNLDDVDSFVIFQGETVIPGTYMPDRSADKDYVIKLWFPSSGRWYVYIRYKELYNIEEIIRTQNLVYIDVTI